MRNETPHLVEERVGEGLDSRAEAEAGRRHRFSLSLTVLAFGLFLLGLLWGTVIHQLRSERAREIANATKHAGNLARTFEEHTARTLREAEQILLFIIEDYHAQGSRLDLRRLVEDGPIISRIYNHFSIIDERGNLALSSRPVTPANFSDREHFRAHAEHDTNHLFVSKPMAGPGSEKPSILLSRRINKPDLRFGGVAVVAVEPEYFSHFYRQLDLGAHGVVTIVGRDDGIIRARRSGEDTTIGQDLSAAALFKYLRESEHGAYFSNSALDGVPRLFSYRALKDYPMVAIVGIGTEEVLSAFNERRRRDLQAAAIASLAITAFTALLLLLAFRQERGDIALRESERRFRAIFDHAGVGITMRPTSSRNRPWVQVNDYFCKLTGYTREELLHISTSDLTPPDEQGLAAKLNERLLRGEITSYTREKQILRKDGRRIWINLAVASLPDREGLPRNVISVYQDITKRKDAEAARAELASIVESSNDAIISRSLDRRILSWNAAAERLFGWTAAETIGHSVALFIPPEHAQESARNQALVQANRPVPPYDTVRHTKDGRRIDVSLTHSVIRNEQGDAIGVSLILRDISERKRSEEAERRRAAIIELTAKLASAANQADQLENALTESLRLVSEHGGWALGHVATFAPGQRARVPLTSLWHGRDQNRFRRLVQASDNMDHMLERGQFAGRAIREKRPVWIEDLSRIGAGERLREAVRAGARAAFAFPVLVGEEVLAYLEFFADDTRPADEMLLDALPGIGAQLARLIERERARNEIRTREIRLRAILDAEPECVKVMAADGTLLEVNRAGLAMFEAGSFEELRRHGVLEFPLPEHRAAVAAQFEKALAGESTTLEFEMTGLSGTRRWMEARAVPIVLPESGATAVVTVSRDVTERKRAQEQIFYLSQYDTLTGLPNRNLFRDRLDLALARAKRHRNMLGIVLFNLDRFRQVNEGLGLPAGDELLRQVAARLRDTLRGVDTIARLGGDEFAILVEGAATAAEVAAVAEKLMRAFAAPFNLDESEIVASASIGFALYPNGTDDPQKLIEHAELALQRVKREGGVGYRMYEEEPHTHVGRRLDIESRLRYALARGELTVHYQPRVRASTEAIVGAEALLRWHNPELGNVSPAKFIPIAEETGLIIPIGEWVLRTACAQMQSWHAQGHRIGIAVNLSPRQFRQKDLTSTVAAVLAQTGLAPSHLELEITEGTAMANAESAIQTLGELHDCGLTLAVDDFGTGYSSLAYLKRFPIDSLKIDRSFVNDIGNANSEAIVCATIALAHNLKLRVVAEGVETEAHRDFLARAGCDEYQGYFFGRPVPAGEFHAVLLARSTPGNVK